MNEYNHVVPQITYIIREKPISAYYAICSLILGTKLL